MRLAINPLCEICITSIKRNQNFEVLARPRIVEAGHENKLDLCLFWELYLQRCPAVYSSRPIVGREVIENRVLELRFKFP